MKRRGSLSSSASSLSACSSAIAPPPGAHNKTYMEFHASMSLDNPASTMDFLASAASFEGALSGRQHEQVTQAPSFEHTTMEEVLKQRFHIWSRVQDVRDAVAISGLCVVEDLTPLEAYACGVAALKKLQGLHHLCNILPSIQMHLLEISNGPQQRETHLRTLQLALLHERNLRTSKNEGVPGPAPVSAQSGTALSSFKEPNGAVKTPATTAMRADSNPDPAALVEQLVESLETFDGDDAIDLFQLAM